jgi:hypothetical protein
MVEPWKRVVVQFAGVWATGAPAIHRYSCSRFRIQDGAVLMFDAVHEPAGNPNGPTPLLAVYPMPGWSVAFSDAPGEA